MSRITPPRLVRIGDWFFGLFFPGDCRICSAPLTAVSRIPVCPACLAKPKALIAEFYCSRCRAPFRSRYPLDDNGECALCRAGANGFDDAYSFGVFEGELRELIHLFKYSGVETLAAPLGGMLANALDGPLGENARFDAIVPMPLHWRRRWRRGFNQSRLLANEIGRRYRIPVRDLAVRRRSTKTQAGLTHAQRRDNVAGAFAVRRPERIAGQRVLLIDDVLTTGATAAACAGALKRAGALHVTFAAVARADRRQGLFSPTEPE